MSDEKGCGSCNGCECGPEDKSDKKMKDLDDALEKAFQDRFKVIQPGEEQAEAEPEQPEGEEPEGEAPPPPPPPTLEETIGHMVNRKNKGLSEFAGVLPISRKLKLDNPMLVSASAIGGPKALLYFATQKFLAGGLEIANQAVNDILCTGAKPMFFMDNVHFLGMPGFHPKVLQQVVQGVEVACDYTDMTLLGGRTMGSEEELFKEEFFCDISGTCVGIVNRGDLIDGSDVEPGDVLIGLPSDGLNAGGFHVIQTLIKEKKVPWYESKEEMEKIKEIFKQMHEAEDKEGMDKLAEEYRAKYKVIEEFAERLLKPTPQYYAAVNAIQERVDIHGMAHIKNGGLVENLPRMIPDKEQLAGLTFDISVINWEPPELFHEIKAAGEFEDDFMWQTFNNGIGFVVAVAPEDEPEVMEALEDAYIDGAVRIGSVIERDGDKEVNIE